MPVLATQSKRDPWQAEGTVFGDLRVHRLGAGRVRHREVLIQQLLRDHVLETKINAFALRAAGKRLIHVSANQYQLLDGDQYL